MIAAVLVFGGTLTFVLKSSGQRPVDRELTERLLKQFADMGEARIWCHPNEVLVDEQFTIHIEGLIPQNQYTIQSVLQEDSMTFSACGCYLADVTGNVSVTQHASLAGTYTGVEPMGLIWSMEQAPGQRLGLRLCTKDITKPQIVTLLVYKGHHSLEDIYQQTLSPLVTTELKRYYKADNVIRIPVSDGNVRGALFLPSVKGRFPGVIDMFGSTGGLMEYRSSLLASRGFTVLCLAFFGYKDLPKTFFSLTVDYFKEAISLLYNHPNVTPGGIGMLGVSKSGEYIQLLGLRCPQVKAIVTINAPPCMTLPYILGEEELPLTNGGSPEYYEMSEEGIIMKNSFLKGVSVQDIIPLWKSDVKFLNITGTDDQCVHRDVQTLQYEAFPVEKRKNIELVVYQGAGHLIEPPYSPLCRTSYSKYTDGLVVWGGQPKEHALAQEDSWQRIQEFFRKHLLSDTDNTVEQTNLKSLL